MLAFKAEIANSDGFWSQARAVRHAGFAV